MFLFTAALAELNTRTVKRAVLCQALALVLESRDTDHAAVSAGSYDSGLISLVVSSHLPYLGITDVCIVLDDAKSMLSKLPYAKSE